LTYPARPAIAGIILRILRTQVPPSGRYLREDGSTLEGMDDNRCKNRKKMDQTRSGHLDSLENLDAGVGHQYRRRIDTFDKIQVLNMVLQEEEEEEEEEVLV